MSFQALNMHTDMKVSGSADGTVTLTAKDEHGNVHSVTVSSDVARKVHEKAGGRVHLGNGSHHHHGVEAFNMHTDAVVRGGGSSVVISGRASQAGKPDDELTVTIDGPALAELKAANVGL